MKKAWESELDVLLNAKPVVLQEDEQGWLFAENVEAMDDIMLKMKWKSNVPGSGAPERVIVGAIADYEAMGYDVSQAEALIEEGFKAYESNDIHELNRITYRIWNILNNAKTIKNHPYFCFEIYDSFEKYIDEAKLIEPKDVIIDEDYLERTYYGWLAQVCAGALGTALEGYTTKNIREKFGEVRSYVRKPNTYNDDITYEVAFLTALLRKGKALESADIAEEWAALIPFGWSAEEWALKNIKLGIYPPQSGYLHNPYREWIGAQMRGAVCGMVAPANAPLAARLAYMDGVVSHHNNGVLGEIFNAVLTSLAYVESDVRKLTELAIAAIPRASEYYSVVSFALNACKERGNWQQAWADCEQKFKRYNWIHAYPNAAAEVVALWFGEGDFDQTMHIICMEGYDVDCNAAQIATAIGIINRSSTLSDKWIEPIGSTLNTYIRGYKKISLRQLTEMTAKGAKLIK